MLRTHNCGELRINDVGKKVTLAGWVDKIRDLGGIRFLILKDRYGYIQVVPGDNEKVAETLRKLKPEYVIRVSGTVRKRPDEAVRTDIPTGQVEVVADEIEILSEAQTPPIYTDRDDDTSEELRLKYRYLDLRKPRMQHNIIMRHRIVQTIREYLNKNGFLEIETPMLMKSTPEGARDFIVPSRLRPGKFYALPQSPQLLKQILMIAGFDRYYQIARCFRDEDLRADRQPEFSQIDIEMSFVERDDVIEMAEGLVKYVLEKVFNRKLDKQFKRLTYEEAMEKYGTDKPLTHFGMELQELEELFYDTPVNFIKAVLEKGGTIKGFVVPRDMSSFTRKRIDSYTKMVQELGLGGLIWVKNVDEPRSSIDRISPGISSKIVEHMKIPKGGGALIAAGEREVLNEALGILRVKVAQDMGMIDADELDLLWIIDFPMFEWDDEENRLVARHHPFTMPHPEDMKAYPDDPLKIRSLAYDLVMNGNEIAGGSIRIHSTELQRWVFEKIGITENEANEKFGFLLEAMRYGVPPHGGIAFGLDRFVMILLKEKSIREVMAFPKTTTGADLMMGAPSNVPDEMLKELKIRVMENTREV
ncbi:MAG: aspartate--tRNA ligase [Thermotogae bacterium]|nr:aspartate--tRNA ligase [Thermotogota bacterium]